MVHNQVNGVPNAFPYLKWLFVETPDIVGKVHRGVSQNVKDSAKVEHKVREGGLRAWKVLDLVTEVFPCLDKGLVASLKY